VPFRPEDFLAAARKISLNEVLPSGEARYRTIAGRSYYAAYLATCEAIIIQHKLPDGAYLPHATVSETLAAYEKDIDVKKLGGDLNSLRLLRIRADYRCRMELVEDQSDDAMTYATTILAALPSVRAKLPKIDPVEQDKHR
jgi:hypothetical protein